MKTNHEAESILNLALYDVAILGKQALDIVGLQKKKKNTIRHVDRCLARTKTLKE